VYGHNEDVSGHTTTQTHLGQAKGQPGGKRRSKPIEKLLPAITTICTYNVRGAALLQLVLTTKT